MCVNWILLGATVGRPNNGSRAESSIIVMWFMLANQRALFYSHMTLTSLWKCTVQYSIHVTLISQSKCSILVVWLTLSPTNQGDGSSGVEVMVGEVFSLHYRAWFPIRYFISCKIELIGGLTAQFSTSILCNFYYKSELTHMLCFQEQLKQNVVKFVRQKFLKTYVFLKDEELHQFLSELSVLMSSDATSRCQRHARVHCKPKLHYIQSFATIQFICNSREDHRMWK